MSRALLYKLLIISLPLLLSACIHPISKEVRDQISPDTTFAVVHDNPVAFKGHKLLLCGAITAIEDDEDGSLFEVMEWQQNSWGEPTYLDDSGRRFLVKSALPLDPAAFEPGVLVTLAGVVIGQKTRPLEEHDYNYPVFELEEIHLWESPFRYGIHRNVDPGTPFYVGQDDNPDRHPYDPSYSTYPYTPYTYRNRSPYR